MKFYIKSILITAVVVGAIWGVWELAQIAGVQPAPDKLLAVATDDWVKGDSVVAQAVLVEYLDFECPACAAYHPIVNQLIAEFGDTIAVVQRYFPLPGHRNGLSSALAAEAAGQQGKYWEMHDLLFESQEEWRGKALPNSELFVPYAEKLGLDVEQFKSDMGSKELADRVNRDRKTGVTLGVQGTPTFFLNGEKLINPRSFADFKVLVEAAILTGRPEQETSAGTEVHEHADFKVYINGTVLDFTLPKYQSSEDAPLHEYTHLHDGVGHIIHKHRTGVTVGDFITSLGMQFTRNCFVSDTGEEFCNGEKEALTFFVNGVSNDQFGDYELHDLDRILISYGSESGGMIQAQMQSVTDEACIYSEKCPERGEAPTENCVGGLGTTCD